MARLKGLIVVFFLISTLFEASLARLINTTIYDTNLAHITYEPRDDFCVRWTNSWGYWRSCELWAQPWRSDLYFSHGRFVTVHRSLNHQLPSVAIEFEGSAIWLYGPPRAQLAAIPPDYKVCLYEDYRLASQDICYRVRVAEAYSTSGKSDEPVVIFAKGGLQYQQHRVVISVGDPIDNTQAYLGVQFSHAVYPIERPTPWPVEEDHWRFRQVIVHDTHPLLSYHPVPRAPSCFGPWCSGTGWLSKTYRAEDGAVVSWHELKSRNEWNQDLWGVETAITAGSVTIYGIPKAHITETDFLSQICVRIDFGRCEIVDVRHAYLNSEHYHESVLLWRHDALDPNRKTHLVVRLVETDSEETNVFPFKEIRYFEPQEYSSPDMPIGYLENVEITHDNEAIVYHPGRRCVRHFAWRCTKWFDPWVWREEGSSETRLTYRSTVSSFRTTKDPAITLDFQGSAVFVYGAPKSFIKTPFASQHVCINDVCHIVDVEQAYLNAPVGAELRAFREHEMENSENSTLSNVHPEYEPVLIWSMTGIDDQTTHNLRLALASLPSDDNAEMTIAKVVYTKVSYEPGQSRPDIPIPRQDPQHDGPTYPPHAENWAPRRPSLPSPVPSRLPAPSNPRPTVPQAPLPPSSPPDSAPNSTDIVLLVVALIAISFVLLVVYLSLLALDRGERSPLLSRLRGGALAYSNNGIRTYAKA